MPPHRHRKFVRSKEPPGQLRIQPRDEELFRDLASYRFLDTEQIFALHPAGERNARRRLATLFHMGFLDRPVQQKSFAKQGMSLIYGLGEKGKEFFVEDFDAPERKQREVTFPYLQHAMMISHFHSAFVLALRKHEPKEEITRWIQGQDLKEALSREGEKTDLVPDAYFRTEDEKGTLNFFVEADQGTMTRQRFLEKMKIYWHWWRIGYCKQTLDVERFRVLTITPTEERKESLRRITKKADTRQDGSLMFEFLSETQYSTKKPDAVLEPVWMSPKDEVRRKLLE